jgi:hypothetical protein
MASMSESLAFALAVAMSEDALLWRSETAERLSKPTAMSVSRIIRLRVTTSAKP